MSRHTLGFVILLLAALLLVFGTEARSTTGERILVLLDDLSDQALYSKFFKSLQDRHYGLTFKLPSDASADLLSYELLAYDHVINFAPKTQTYHSYVGPVSMVNFVNKGGNVLVGASEKISETVRTFASEFGVEFAESDTFVIDHFNFDAVNDEKGKHTAIFVGTDTLTTNKAILSDEMRADAPVLFRGIAHRIGTSPMATRIAWASSTAYSAGVKENATLIQDPFALGPNVALASALQARNNARVTFVGSLELFQDKFFDAKPQKIKSTDRYQKSGNAAFAKELTEWTFQEKGVLQVVARQHHKEGETEERQSYRVGDRMQYTIEISEYTINRWRAYNATDVQLEVIMLDPYIRTTLEPLRTTERQAREYRADVKLPDVYGVYTLKVNYKRPGYSYIEDAVTVSLRPFRHDEFPRYISNAYPYYTGAASMIVGFLVFSTVWIFNKEEGKDSAAQAKKTK